MGQLAALVRQASLLELTAYSIVDDNDSLVAPAFSFQLVAQLIGTSCIRAATLARGFVHELSVRPCRYELRLKALASSITYAVCLSVPMLRS